MKNQLHNDRNRDEKRAKRERNEHAQRTLEENEARFERMLDRDYPHRQFTLDQHEN